MCPTAERKLFAAIRRQEIVQDMMKITGTGRRRARREARHEIRSEKRAADRRMARDR